MEDLYPSDITLHLRFMIDLIKNKGMGKAYSIGCKSGGVGKDLAYKDSELRLQH